MFNINQVQPLTINSSTISKYMIEIDTSSTYWTLDGSPFHGSPAVVRHGATDQRGCHGYHDQTRNDSRLDIIAAGCNSMNLLGECKPAWMMFNDEWIHLFQLIMMNLTFIMNISYDRYECVEWCQTLFKIDDEKNHRNCSNQLLSVLNDVPIITTFMTGCTMSIPLLNWYQVQPYQMCIQLVKSTALQPYRSTTSGSKTLNKRQPLEAHLFLLQLYP